MLKLRIWWLKRRLRSAIYRFEERYIDYDCGKYVLDNITGSQYAKDEAYIDSLKNKLRAIDPNCPGYTG